MHYSLSQNSCSAPITLRLLTRNSARLTDQRGNNNNNKTTIGKAP